MKATLLRTASIPTLSLLHNFQNGAVSPTALSFPSRTPSFGGSIRRSSSDTDVGRAGSFSRAGSFASFPDMGIIVEEDWCVTESGGFGTGNGKGNKSHSLGGGKGKGKGGNDEDRTKIGDHYKQMLKSNPGDSLLLRNYAKYLHEVEKNAEKAEEYYGRAILASPGDGELLSLYGNLIWETQKDEDRARSYFDQAVHASPDDCMVLGSYAHFLWESEEDEEDVEETKLGIPASPAMVGVY